jgi:hypothetical protein
MRGGTGARHWMGYRNLNDVSETEGGTQVEYEDEDPRIHRMFEEELARHGAVCRMRALVSRCTGS